jgi:hypothetical protein
VPCALPGILYYSLLLSSEQLLPPGALCGLSPIYLSAFERCLRGAFPPVAWALRRIAACLKASAGARAPLERAAEATRVCCLLGP